MNERHQSDHDQDQTNDRNGFHAMEACLEFMRRA
jgi:hypothetical protein